jgi:hypothetical protein
MWKKMLFITCVSVSFLFPYTSIAQSDPYEMEIYINLWTKTLSLIQSGQIVKSYPIAPGAPNTPTPVGDFRVIHKSENWGTGFGSRWLGLSVPFGRYGIHGTNKPHLIGRYASHGCIRMRNSDIEDLFPLVKLNTRVRIDGPMLGKEGLDYRILVRGSRGSLVMAVQNRLRAGGFYKGSSHGIFDLNTENAVKQYQKNNRLPVTGQIQFVDLVQLGLVE